MLERMKSIFERIDEINRSFQGISPHRARREKQTFAAALQEATKTVPPKEPALTPEPAVAPASRFGLTSPFQPPLPSLPANSTGTDAAAPGRGGSESQLQQLIETHAARNGLDPALVRQIIQVESGFDPRSVSSKGAMGLMQLMPETAQDLGVKNPFDPDQNIGGGTRYLAQLLQSHNGDLTKALASYNAGPRIVQEYGGVPPYPETRNFVQRVLQGLKTQTNSSIE